jgi:hypothetical protein
MDRTAGDAGKGIPADLPRCTPCVGIAVRMHRCGG